MLFFLCCSALAVAAESGPGAALDLSRLPVPPSLAAVLEAERLDYLLANIDENEVFFNYLLNVYVKIPSLMGQAPAAGPGPEETLRRLSERRIALEAEYPPPDPTNTAMVHAAMEQKPFRQWLRVVGALAAGKRAANASDGDGGEEYVRFFRYSDALVREDPELLFAMVREFCQYGASPPRSHRDSPIGRGHESVRHFLPVVLFVDRVIEREPDLGRLVPAVVSPWLLEEVFERTAPETWESFPALARTAWLLTAFRQARFGRPPTGARGVEGFRVLDTPMFILRSCIEHGDFGSLPEKRRDEVTQALEFFQAEVERREKESAPDDIEADDVTDEEAAE
jgi:hypothetical protein